MIDTLEVAFYFISNLKDIVLIADQILRLSFLGNILVIQALHL